MSEFVSLLWLIGFVIWWTLVLSQRVRCWYGFHFKIGIEYELLTEQPPWSWRVRVVCLSCRKTLSDGNLDERDAQEFFREKS